MAGGFTFICHCCFQVRFVSVILCWDQRFTMMMWLCLTTVALAMSTAFCASLSSPCPAILRYTAENPGSWEAELVLNSEADLHGVWLRIILDGPVKDLSVADNFGEVVADPENSQFLIKNRNHFLKANQPTKVRIATKYEGEKVPALIGFRLNARTFCPEHGGENLQWIENFPAQQNNANFFLGDLNNKDFLSTLSATENSVGCGEVPLKNQEQSEGSYPWHASVYVVEGDSFSFACGGVLVSPSHVLTAAHCVTKKNSNDQLNSASLGVRLGQHFLKSNNKGLQELRIAQITVHPGYNRRNYANDLAVLRLDKAATLTDYVRPVCLWNESPNTESVLRRQGLVSGWGFDAQGRYTNRLTEAPLSVLSHSDCFASDPKLAGFLNENSLCAGYSKGSSICAGESGSGLVFPREDKSAIYQLRGLVSIGTALQNKLVCDESSHVILTDIARYLDWLKPIIA